MTDKEKLEAVKAEIKRLKRSNGVNGRPSHIAEICYDELLSFINSLPEEPVSKDLEDAALMHYKDVMEYETKTGLKPAYMTSFKAGAKWQKEQMMAKAINTEIHIDAGGYPYIPQIELYDYDKDVPLAKEGDKYKVVLIKED